MNTAIWIVQILLSLAFLMAGFMKATKSKEELQENMKWVEDFSASQVRMIGILEILAAIGLILPMLINILPVLTPLAAVGVILTMIGAVVVHIRRGETSSVIVPVVMIALATFVVYGRLVAEAVI